MEGQRGKLITNKPYFQNTMESDFFFFCYLQNSESTFVVFQFWQPLLDLKQLLQRQMASHMPGQKMVLELAGFACSCWYVDMLL